MNRLTVHYQGQCVGTLAETSRGLVFEFDAAFQRTGHELSPLQLPLGPGLRTRGPAQLPGLFEDSMPDAWGRRIMLEWFRRQEVPATAVSPLAILAYVGDHGMGALSYRPARRPEDVEARVSLEQLHAASDKLEQTGAVDLSVLAAVGSSAGGARPKAVVALPRSGAGETLAGAGRIPATHEAWLVKFDTSPDRQTGPLEEAYARMARAAGIDFPETRLLETRDGTKARLHFAVKRFDRNGNDRVHHHTLAAMTHVPGGDLSYETLLRVTRRITQDEREVWRAYRRAAFNVIASNRDDHGKNHGFLYCDRQWTLGPAYDVTFRSPAHLPERGMAIAGERRTADASHLTRLAESEGLDRRQAADIVDQVRAAVSRWREFADQSEVTAIVAAETETVLRSQPGFRAPPRPA